MILVWVIALFFLCSSLNAYLEHVMVLRVKEVAAIELAQNQFMTSEKSVLECEKNISELTVKADRNCIIQLAGKNIWLISSKEKPVIQVHVYLDEQSGLTTRLNWRQAFE